MAEEIQRNVSAPEILAALRKLQADLAATRADIRTLAERPATTGAGTAGAAESGTASEVQRTTGALNEESAARERSVSLAREELVAQRAITAEVERTLAAYAKLSETRGGASLTTRASAAEAQAAIASQQRLATIAPPPIAAESAGALGGIGMAAGAERASPALKSYSAELTNASQRQAEFVAAQGTGGAANGQFISSLAKGDITLREFGGQLASTGGKFAQWTAAAGGVFAVIGIFDELYKGARDSSSGVSQLQRSIDNLDTEKAQSDFRRLASELNVPIKEASDAVFGFSRVFPHLDDAVAAAGVGLRALKVDGVALTASTPALTAVHQQFGVTAQGLGGVFDMLDEAQRRYAGRVTNTIQVLQKSTAAVKDAGGSLEGLIQLSTLASRLTGQPGNQIGTAFYRAASNTVQNPTNQNLIKGLGLNPEEASHEFTNFLKTAIRMSAGKSGDWQRELAIAVGGKQQGGKIFEPLFSGGASGVKLLKEIEENITPQKSKGSTQQELGRILEQTDERVNSLKLSLQQMGAELERAGGTAGLGVLLVTVTDTLKAVNSLLDGFNLLPHPVKELIVVLLEAKLAMLALQRTALGTGLANATGLSFLGPSREQQAARAERGAQETALGGVQGLQGSTLVREQQLRTQAVVNETEIALLREEEAGVATAEERVVIKERIQALESESVALSQEGNALLTEQAAQQEVATALQARINALRAGATPAAGFFPVPAAGAGAAAAGAGAAAAGGEAAASGGEIAALVGGGLFAKIAGIPELLSGSLTLLLKGAFAGIIADVGAQMAGQMIGGGAGKTISGLSGDIGIGAGAGFALGGPMGALAGGLGGTLFGLVKEDLKGEKPTDQTSLNQAVQDFTTKLGPTVLHAQAGELSPQRLKEIQATLSSMLNDPGFEKFKGTLKDLQTQLIEVSKGSTDAAQALAKAKLFNTYQDIAGQNPKQAKETIEATSLKATTTGASAANVKLLTEELDSLAGNYGGGEDKEGLTALQLAETKLLESSKKNAQDLADKAKQDPNLGTKTSSYKEGLQALDAATAAVQNGYKQLAGQITTEQKELQKLEKERAAEGTATGPNKASPAQIATRESNINELRKTIEGNKSRLGQIRKATEYETNQLKAAREQAAEAAFTDISNTLDVNSGLAQAQTQDKGAQLKDALQNDNDKLKLAAELFGKKSIQYKKVLTEVLKAQQAIVEQAVTNIDVQGKLEASEVRGTGPEAEIKKTEINLNAQRQELATLNAGHADPTKIKQMQTQINETENTLAKNVQARAKTVTDALAQIAESKVQDPLAKARIALRAAEKNERGLQGTELLQQKATVAQKRSDVYQQATDEKIAQLKYEHSVEGITDNAYISSLQQIIATRKMASATKRQLLQEIFQLQKGSASGLELNVGSIKLPSIYEIRRAIAGGKTGSLNGQLSVQTNNEFKINVSKGGDEHKVYREIDRAMHTTAKAAARAAGAR